MFPGGHTGTPLRRIGSKSYPNPEIWHPYTVPAPYLLRFSFAHCSLVLRSPFLPSSFYRKRRRSGNQTKKQRSWYGGGTDERVHGILGGRSSCRRVTSSSNGFTQSVMGTRNDRKKGVWAFDAPSSSARRRVEIDLRHSKCRMNQMSEEPQKIPSTAGEEGKWSTIPKREWH